MSLDTTHSTGRKRDGDGRIVKSYENRTVVQVYPAGSSTIEETEYYVRSSMLGGQVLTEVNSTGGKIKTKVYAGSGVIAEQIAASSSVVWRHTDVVTGSFNSTGTFPPNDPEFKAEFEPLGAILPEQDPNPDPQTAPMPNRYKYGGDFSDPEQGCVIDGFLQNSLEPCLDRIADVTGMLLQERDLYTPVIPQIRGYWTDEDDPRVGPVGDNIIRIGTLAVFHPMGIGVFERQLRQASDACNGMAGLLGTMIDAGIKAMGGVDAIKTHQQLDGLMNALDAQFTPFYTGWNGTIATATTVTTPGGQVGPSGGGIERKPPLGGTGGFKKEYLDSITETEGQTHHFAAYFSAGINSSWFKAVGHALSTDNFGSQDNRNDRALGAVAYGFGSSLQNLTHDEERYNPHNPKVNKMVTVNDAVSDRLGRFTSLASRVRTKICN